MEILDIVRKITGDTENDDMFSVFIDIVIQRVLNFCNIRELPDELRYTVALMVKDIYEEELTKKQLLSGEAVNSVSEDGRSVSFSSKLITDVRASADERIEKTRDLKRFKSLYRV